MKIIEVQYITKISTKIKPWHPILAINNSGCVIRWFASEKSCCLLCFLAVELYFFVQDSTNKRCFFSKNCWKWNKPFWSQKKTRHQRNTARHDFWRVNKMEWIRTSIGSEVFRVFLWGHFYRNYLTLKVPDTCRTSMWIRVELLTMKSSFRQASQE